MNDENLVGGCGLYCGACSIHRAYKDGGEYLKRLSEHFKCPPEKVKCEGCQVLTPTCWGNDCKIVQCTIAKGYRFCYECPQYQGRSCEEFEELAKRYLEDNVDVRASLEKIKSGKVKEWLKESNKRFRCPHCKKPLPEGSKKCYHCGRKLIKIL